MKKKLIFIFALFSLPLYANHDYGVGDFDCTVNEAAMGNEQSLDSLIEKANNNEACRSNVTFLNAMRIALSEPLTVSALNLFLTGADMSADFDDVRALGVVIDGRAIRNDCVIRVTDPQQSVLTSLTIYTNDRNKAICDEEGRSVLASKSAAYNANYTNITVCRGENQCNWNDYVPYEYPFYTVFYPLPGVVLIGSGGMSAGGGGSGSVPGSGGMSVGSGGMSAGGGGAGGISPDRSPLIDSDGDGIFNNNDACTYVRGTVANSGCPASYCIQTTADGLRVGQYRIGIDQDGDGIDRACDSDDNLTPTRDRIVPPPGADLGGCSLIPNSDRNL